MEKPFFSVVIPVYNREKFIERSIKSVLSQSFTDFEVVVIDDGSTDKTAALVQKLVKDDKRVSYIRQENKGRCIARNTGIENASADWVCFLDSDDEYLPNHLQTMQHLILEQPDYNAFATEQLVNTSKREYPKKHMERPVSIVTFKDFVYGNPLQINQFCFNKKAIKTRFVNERIPISEDWLFMRTLTLNHAIYKVNTVTNRLHEHEARSMNATHVREIVKWNEYAGIYLVQHHLTSGKMKALLSAHTYLLCANILLSNKLKKEAKPYLKKALGYLPAYTHPLLYKGLIKMAI